MTSEDSAEQAERFQKEVWDALTLTKDIEPAISRPGTVRRTAKLSDAER